MLTTDEIPQPLDTSSINPFSTALDAFSSSSPISHSEALNSWPELAASSGNQRQQHKEKGKGPWTILTDSEEHVQTLERKLEKVVTKRKKLEEKELKGKGGRREGEVDPVVAYLMEEAGFNASGEPTQLHAALNIYNTSTIEHPENGDENENDSLIQKRGTALVHELPTNESTSLLGHTTTARLSADSESIPTSSLVWTEFWKDVAKKWRVVGYEVGGRYGCLGLLCCKSGDEDDEF